jgi:hypothetical protein
MIRAPRGKSWIGVVTAALVAGAVVASPIRPSLGQPRSVNYLRRNFAPIRVSRIRVISLSSAILCPSSVGFPASRRGQRDEDRPATRRFVAPTVLSHQAPARNARPRLAYRAHPLRC